MLTKWNKELGIEQSGSVFSSQCSFLQYKCRETGTVVIALEIKASQSCRCSISFSQPGANERVRTQSVKSVKPFGISISLIYKPYLLLSRGNDNETINQTVSPQFSECLVRAQIGDEMRQPLTLAWSICLSPSKQKLLLHDFDAWNWTLLDIPCISATVCTEWYLTLRIHYLWGLHILLDENTI